MPTYVYTCERCGESVEAFQSFSDAPLETHEDCGGSLRKVFHPSGIVFKGSGFYKTDSRSSGSKTSGGSSSSGSSSSTSSSDGD